MHPIVESFFERPTAQRAAMAAGFLIFLIFIFWMYFYSDLAESITKLDEEIENLEVQKSNEQRLSKNLDKFRSEVKSLDVKLSFVLQELPDEKEIPDLLASISSLATDSGLEINLFRPKPENVKDFYAEVPVEVAVSGTYHQVASFFDEVGNLSRIVNIDKIELVEPKVEQNTEAVPLKATCVATTFRYLDEKERSQLAKQQETKKRKRK